MTHDDELEMHLATLSPLHALGMVLVVMVVAVSFGVARVVTAPWRWLRCR